MGNLYILLLTGSLFLLVGFIFPIEDDRIRTVIVGFGILIIAVALPPVILTLIQTKRYGKKE